MSTQPIIDTINIIDHGADVFVVLRVGDIQRAEASLALRDAGGTTGIADPMEPGKPYNLGPADSLIGLKIMVCVAALSDPGGGSGNPYFAICNFFQGGVHVGSSSPFAGSYPPGEALANVNFIARFA